MMILITQIKNIKIKKWYKMNINQKKVLKK